MSRFFEVVALGYGWWLLADGKGEPYVSDPAGNVCRLDLGPPCVAGWLRVLEEYLSNSERMARVRIGDAGPTPWSRHLEEAARTARHSWTTDVRHVWVIHACGHLFEHRIREQDIAEWQPRYAAEVCPECDPSGFWDGNPGRSGKTRPIASREMREKLVDPRNR